MDAQINFRYFDEAHIGIALDETSSVQDVRDIAKVFARSTGASVGPLESAERAAQLPLDYPEGLTRKSAFLTHAVFNTHHSETQMMRYLKSLERKDIGLDTSMIPLGSCTMKLTAATEMRRRSRGRPSPISTPSLVWIKPRATGRSSKNWNQPSAPSRGWPASRSSRTRAPRENSPG